METEKSEVTKIREIETQGIVIRMKQKKKILSIFGTRPEAIKMAPLVKRLEKEEQIESIVCVTAQHRQMLDQVLHTFQLRPDYDLDIMKEHQSLMDITVTVLQKLDVVLQEVKPDMILVHGDTTTAYAAALAAYYQQIPIGHVEAGLRTYDKYSPYPEEMNRQMIDAMCDLCFAPTQVSKENLLKQSIPEDKIIVTGNTVIDAMATTIKDNYHHAILDWVGDDKLLLVTVHRRENLGAPMRSIFKGIRRVLEDTEHVKAVFPIHYNPAVRAIAKAVFGDCEKMKQIEPLDVFDFHNFQNRAHLILSDSGGIQEEAPSLGKPVLVLRNTTERPEGVAAGTLKLVGTQEEAVYQATMTLLTDENAYQAMSHAANPYGDGHASERIVQAIHEYFKH